MKLTRSLLTAFRDRRILLAGLALLFGLATPAFAAPPTDPVEQLQKALTVRPTDTINPSPQFFRHREETLQKYIGQLNTLGELRRALSLKEWKDEGGFVEDRAIQQLDARLRRQVANRFLRVARAIVAKGDPTAKLALANLIAEMGPVVRSVGDAKSRAGFGREMTEEVKQLVNDKNLAVRQEGLRALGNINPEPERAVPVFARTLQTDIQGPRRLAAEGLGQLVRVANHLLLRGKEFGIDVTTGELLNVARQVVPAAALGLKDPDTQVRAASVETIQEASRALTDLVPKPFQRTEFPPEGRPLTEQERNIIAGKQEQVRREIAELSGLLQAFQALNPELARALQDPDKTVQKSALDTLVNLAFARAKLLERARSVPVLANQPPTALSEPLLANDPVRGFINGDWTVVARLLHLANCDDVGLRRSAIDFFELIEDAALPALPSLIAALGDPDHFVRLSAARTLGNLPPEKVVPAVPALGKLLFDPDYNVKLVAAAALESIGPYARAAAPALAQALLVGDSENRAAVMYALASLGPANAAPAVPNLIANLTNADRRVRALAAQTLGKLGPVAQPAIPALRRALGDEDQEVRINASEALLNIIPLPQED